MGTGMADRTCMHRCWVMRRDRQWCRTRRENYGKHPRPRTPETVLCSSYPIPLYFTTQSPSALRTNERPEQAKQPVSKGSPKRSAVRRTQQCYTYRLISFSSRLHSQFLLHIGTTFTMRAKCLAMHACIHASRHCGGEVTRHARANRPTRRSGRRIVRGTPHRANRDGGAADSGADRCLGSWLLGESCPVSMVECTEQIPPHRGPSQGTEGCEEGGKEDARHGTPARPCRRLGITT